MWTAIVPVKAWRSGKSRLDLPPDARAAVARRMTLDVLTVLTGHPMVARVVVVTVDEDAAREARALGAVVLAEDLGLNDAVRRECTWVVAEGGDGPTVVVPADLGFLTESALTDALTTLQRIGRRHANQLAGVGDELDADDVRKQAFIFRRKANLPADIELALAEIEAQNLAGAAVDGDQAQERANHRRLAGAVGAKQTNRAGRNAQREIVERADAPIRLRDAGELK